MSNSLVSLKLQFPGLKIILLFPNIKKYKFSDLITPKTEIKKFQFWTKAMDYNLRKISIFWSFKYFNFFALKTVFLPSGILKTIFSENFCKKQIRKSSSFEQKPCRKCPFFGPLKTSIFWNKNSSFLSRISKKHILSHNFCKKTLIRKSLNFGQKPWTNPLGKSRFLALFKSTIFWSKIHFLSFQNIKKSSFLT